VVKEHIDLYFILKRISRLELLALCAVKLPQLDRALILKALVFFDDLDDKPILYVKDGAIPFEEVKKFMRSQGRTRY